MRSALSVFFPLLLAACAPAVAVAPVADGGPGGAPSYHLAACYPHDADAFTQGLFWQDGALFESTGLVGRSTVREVRLEDGAVLRSVSLPDNVFGEGIVGWGDEILGVTWRAERGFRWDSDTFRQTGTLAYSGEGWGLAQDGGSIVMSDGSAQLDFRDPRDFAVERVITVRYQGRPIPSLNELEYVDGAILANVWMTDYILRIDPADGTVNAVYDLSAISGAVAGLGPVNVLNGIAHDPETHRLFVTGKLWPLLFELRPGPPPEGDAPPCAALPSLRWSSGR